MREHWHDLTAASVVPRRGKALRVAAVDSARIDRAGALTRLVNRATADQDRAERARLAVADAHPAERGAIGSHALVDDVATGVEYETRTRLSGLRECRPI